MNAVFRNVESWVKHNLRHVVNVLPKDIGNSVFGDSSKEWKEDKNNWEDKFPNHKGISREANSDWNKIGELQHMVL